MYKSGHTAGYSRIAKRFELESQIDLACCALRNKSRRQSSFGQDRAASRFGSGTIQAAQVIDVMCVVAWCAAGLTIGRLLVEAWWLVK